MTTAHAAGGRADAAAGRVPLVARRTASSLDELLVGATERSPFLTSDSKSGSSFERVVVDGRPMILKHLHPDGDWTMRALGDVGCRPVEVWTSGLLDALPAIIDHTVVGAASGLGRNGWGGALLMRDVSAELVPPGDAVLDLEVHRRFLDHMAELAATFWGGIGLPDLLPLETRWSVFGPGPLAAEEALGWPDAVPPIAAKGWARFAERAPADVATVVGELRRDADPLVVAARRTPQTFLHGDWKLGNVGAGGDGRTILIDWMCPGVGPIGHDVSWYLALNRVRLPESKETTIDAVRQGLERRGIDTAAWWDAQISLCLLGALVQFGWEKAFDEDDELGWWCDRAREGIRWLG